MPNAIKIGGNFQGNFVRGDVSGSGNVFNATITLSDQQVQKAPGVYAASLKLFVEKVNEQITTNNIPPAQVAPVQQKIEELAKAVEHVQPDDQRTRAKTSDIKAKFEAVVEGLVKVLPKTAAAVAVFTPLAPFSAILGEVVEAVVKAIQSEG
jgi:hypothetical protein